MEESVDEKSPAPTEKTPSLGDRISEDEITEKPKSEEPAITTLRPSEDLEKKTLAPETVESETKAPEELTTVKAADEKVTTKGPEISKEEAAPTTKGPEISKEEVAPTTRGPEKEEITTDAPKVDATTHGAEEEETSTPGIEEEEKPEEDQEDIYNKLGEATTEKTGAPQYPEEAGTSKPDLPGTYGPPPPGGFDQSAFPPMPSGYPGQDTTYDDYEEEHEDPTMFGPGTCRYGGKLYVSAQQIPRDDPCDFCFCFRSDIICLQQSCPPPINGCHEESIDGFCCPR